MAFKKNRTADGDMSRILPSGLVFIALWATVALAGVNEDLVEAARRGDLPELRSLLDRGADVNTKDQDGWTALMIASYEGYREIVKALLAKCADVNVKTDNGITALILASEGDHREVKELLVQAGAK